MRIFLKKKILGIIVAMVVVCGSKRMNKILDISKWLNEKRCVGEITG